MTDLIELAKRFWIESADPARLPEEYSDSANEQISDIFEAEEQISALLRALVPTYATRASLGAVATWHVENLYYSLNCNPLPHLFAAGLTRNDLIRVLSGVYPETLAAMGLPEVATRSLTRDDIQWLVDPMSDRRRDWV